MVVLWVESDHILPEPLADYPANLARDAIAAELSTVGISLSVVSYEEAGTILRSGPGVLLFSATTPEWKKTVSVASRLRSISPKSMFVVGGHHVSALPDGNGTENFDYVITGEGEKALCSILCEIGDDKETSSLAKRPRIIRARRITNIDTLDTPKRSITEIRRNRLRGLMYPTARQQTGSTAVLLSRGCNSCCTFCASQIIWGSRLITRSPAAAVQEVRGIVDNLRCNTMVLVDQAFGEDVKWTRELCSQLETLDIVNRARWYCMAKTSLHAELLGHMAAAGCTKIGFGIETADSTMRASIKRTRSCSSDSLNRLFNACNRAGIFVKAYLMIGFPWETEEYLSTTTRVFLNQLEANELKISFLTPFPGTADWKRYSDQLVSNNWNDFDTVRMPVVYNPSISVKRYLSLRDELLASFYGSQAYSDVNYRMLQAYPEYYESYREFADHLLASETITEDVPWLDWVQRANSFTTQTRDVWVK